MHLPQRKRRILKAIIESYIETAEPVGSKTLALHFDQPISSATIRNEMGELEELGLLEKPHVSAGRVPSYTAYRLYVNELMDHYRVAAREVAEIRARMQRKMREMDNLMVSASKVVAEMTGHTSVAGARRTAGDPVRRCELITVDGGHSYAAIVVTQNAVQNRMLRLDAPVEPSTAAVITTAVNLAITENRLDYLLPAMAQSVGENAAVYQLAQRLIEFIAQIQSDDPAADVVVDGLSRLLENREYHDAARAREVVETVADTGRLKALLSAGAPRMVNIRIGPELDEPSLRDASLIFCR
jgi:heat-inducible transcriptional repressor